MQVTRYNAVRVYTITWLQGVIAVGDGVGGFSLETSSLKM